MSQAPLHLFIETNLGREHNIEQLERQIASIAERKLPTGSAVLLALGFDNLAAAEMETAS